MLSAGPVGEVGSDVRTGSSPRDPRSATASAVLRVEVRAPVPTLLPLPVSSLLIRTVLVRRLTVDSLLIDRCGGRTIGIVILYRRVFDHPSSQLVD